MRKIVIVGIIFMICLSYTFVAFAAQGAQSIQDSRKLIGLKAERGLGNVLFGWTEIPKRVVDITKESNNPFWGLVAGVYQGTLKAMARTASGAVDVITCPLKTEEKPFINPELAIEDIK